MTENRKNCLARGLALLYNPWVGTATLQGKETQMKKSILLSTVFAMAMIGAASAANVTIYYSPTCPHCHNARDFIGNKMAYEYPSVGIEAVNVMEQENLPAFQDVLIKCKYESGGVPVIVIGEECFQGYAPMMDDDLRKAAEVGLSEEEKGGAAEIRKEMENDAQKFRDAHADRSDAIKERGAAVQKKIENDGGKAIYFYAVLAALVLGLGFVLVRKGRKNK
jgi:glutaredoxin